RSFVASTKRMPSRSPSVPLWSCVRAARSIVIERLLPGVSDAITSKVISPDERSVYSPRMQRAQTKDMPAATFGPLLSRWRARRRLSQLDLSVEAGISTRHLSFLETGRSQPSREMVLLLSRALDVPLRDRNQLLTMAGYAPIYRET